MSVRVRFAPSPTGNLHIGGARTALYCYLYAKAKGGKYLLRIEDTDLERSRKEYEDALIEDLKWLGLEHDEGPDKPGDCGPYRQSERKEIYAHHANNLIEKGHAYYCFCTDEELEKKKELVLAQGGNPHYDGKCRNIPLAEARARLEAQEKAVVRFKAPNKSYTFPDLVRGKVVFPEGMVGDFVILRSDGMPVYNYCCVIDDWLMRISHVIRAEDHLNNTVRQLMIYEALEAPIPEFAHVSLLIGKDRQKLSKRHGATSVKNYREQSYLPQAMNNYLALLGWSHPQERDVFTLEEVIPLFDLDRFSKSPAIFDFDKFRWMNGQHLRRLSNEQLVDEVSHFIPEGHIFHHQSAEWKLRCVNLFKEQIEFYQELEGHLKVLFNPEVEDSDAFKEILSWETTLPLAKLLNNEIQQYSGEYLTEEKFNEFLNKVKTELKVKGKPLFMGVRAALTGRSQGPDVKEIVLLTPMKVIQKRLKQIVG